MNFQKIVTAVLAVVFVAAAWRAYGFAGVALAVSGVVMWALLYFNRLTSVLKKAANRPIGYVGSAVMLNAKLKPKVNLLHVIALTQSLGELLSPKGEEPEVYRWTDGTQSYVTCEFARGKLVKWTLYRPPVTDEALPPAAP